MADVKAVLLDKISIHAPREGGDLLVIVITSSAKISIHAPREGGDYAVSLNSADQLKFQSTPPARGATLFFGLW